MTDTFVSTALLLIVGAVRTPKASAPSTAVPAEDSNAKNIAPTSRLEEKTAARASH